MQSDKSPAAYLALGELIDRFEFDVVSVYNDLFFQPALGPLLHLARVVQRARLGPAALNPFTAHPVEIAGQTALLDHASAGRAYLGLVRGSWLAEIGVRTDEAIARLSETIHVVRYLLSARTDGFAGRFYPIPAGNTLRYPIQRSDVPIVVGTWGERTARAVGSLANEVKIGGSANPALVERMRAWLPPHVGVCLGAVTVVDRDRAAARDLARQQVALYLGVVAGLDPTVIDADWLARVRRLAQAQDYAAISRDISDELLDRFAFAGDPDDLVAHAERLQAAGASRVEFGTPHGLDAATGLRLLGEEVLPRLRR